MQTQIDKICDEVGLWPHADLASHAHNYQRFTRHRSDGTEIPYIICGNGGHNVQRLSKTNGGVIRAPQIIQEASKDVRIASRSAIRSFSKTTTTATTAICASSWIKLSCALSTTRRATAIRPKPRTTRSRST
jgi:hypothetical protein